MKKTIPHIIHYCWFGRKDKPQTIQKYIKNWKKILPDYQFFEWTEDNYDIDNAPVYVKEAYALKKYAFVSDYVRIKVLFEYGGIYFDTDIEVVRRFDTILENRELIMGFESDHSLETAFIACTKGHPFIGQFLNSYSDRKFVLADGSLDMSVINLHFSKSAAMLGVDLSNEEYQELDDGKIVVYPREYFSGFDITNWHENPTKMTYTVHHMNASWGTGKQKAYFKIIKLLQRFLGYDGYDKLKAIYDHMKK